MEENVREVEMKVLPPASDRGDEFARLLAYILDDLFPIPGTKYRVGLDPIIGLIPGLGDTSTAAFSSLILVHGLRAGVPRVVLVRMAINILINSLLGSLTGVGDLFSAWFNRTSAIIGSCGATLQGLGLRLPPTGSSLSSCSLSCWRLW